MKTFSLGPRSWAVLTLAGGFAIAAPFLRKSPSSSVASEKPIGPTLAVHPPIPSIGLSGESDAGGSAINEFTVTRVVSGVLPSTHMPPRSRETALPDWAEPESDLDMLIHQGLSSQIQDRQEPILQPIRPWTGRLEDAKPSSAVDSLPASALAYRASPWEGAELAVPAAQATTQPAKSALSARGWPDQQPIWRAEADFAPSVSQGSVGNLVGASSLESQPQTPPRSKIEMPTSQTTSDAQRRFVYQPGFRGD